MEQRERKLIAEEKGAAVFLDRDGTINEEVGHLDRLEKLRLIPGSAEGIRLLNRCGMKVVIVTNQSGIARGLFSEAFVAEVHARLVGMLHAEGAAIDAFYFCPHHPTEGRGEYLRECECRKPAPGLLLRAAAELHLDPARSCMVGDMLRDIGAGNRAGVRTILVRTGYGEETVAQLKADAELRTRGRAVGDRVSRELPGAHEETNLVRPVHIADNLLAGVEWILRNRKA